MSASPTGAPRATSFLDQLDESDRAALVRLGHHRNFRNGSSIIVQGDHSETVWVLLRGCAKVTLNTTDGHQIVLSVLQAGELIGEFEAIDPAGKPRTAGVVALTPVETLALTGHEFRAYLHGHPSAAMVLLRVLIRRLQAADRRRTDAGSSDALHRLARLLVEVADQQAMPGHDRVDMALPLSQHELASLIAASRESVVRALQKLRARGLVDTTRRQITVRDLDALRRIAP